VKASSFLFDASQEGRSWRSAESAALMVDVCVPSTGNLTCFYSASPVAVRPQQPFTHFAQRVDLLIVAGSKRLGMVGHTARITSATDGSSAKAAAGESEQLFPYGLLTGH
jgi:hypothetical protein